MQTTEGGDGLFIRAIEDKSAFGELMIKAWGSPRMMVQMVTYDVTEIDATGLYDGQEQLLAVASWTIRGHTAYLCALHSLTTGNGYARRLLTELKADMKARGARTMRAMVTNDNMPGMVFYQKQGFRFANLYVGAVDAYRPVMPGMITHGYRKIPVHDALELEIEL